MLVPLGSGPDVVALIPTLALSDRLARCVESVASSDTSLRVAILVIVNSPADEPKAGDVPAGVEVVRAGLNLGWAGGLRFGRSLVEAPFLWLVQDDMTASADTLAVLHGALSTDPTLGVVSPVEVEADGTVRVGSWGGVLDADANMTWLPTQVMQRPLPSDLPDLDYVPSRGMLVRTSAWDAVRGMDPRYYPVMWADVDFCVAAARHGMRISLVPQAEVAHTQQASTGRPWAEFLFERNRELFLSRWFPHLPPDRERSVATSVRPVPPELLSGVVDPGIPPDLLAEVAQAAADATLHLGRFLGRVTSDHADALAAWEVARAAAEATIGQLEATVGQLEATIGQLEAMERTARRDHESERLALQAHVDELAALLAEREAALERDRIEAQEQLAEQQRELDDARAESGRLRRRIEELLSSTSWRITRPARLVSDVLARRRGT
jgi:GT2 family glycosyltransferase